MFTLIDEILWPLAWLSGGKLNYVTWIENLVFFLESYGEREGKAKNKWCNYNMKNKRDNLKGDSQKLKEEMVTFWVFRYTVNYFPNFINLKYLLYVLKSGSVLLCYTPHPLLNPIILSS